jgi:hypothetical protein
MASILSLSVAELLRDAVQVSNRYARSEWVHYVGQHIEISRNWVVMAFDPRRKGANRVATSVHGLHFCALIDHPRATLHSQSGAATVLATND